MDPEVDSRSLPAQMLPAPGCVPRQTLERRGTCGGGDAVSIKKLIASGNLNSTEASQLKQVWGRQDVGLSLRITQKWQCA